MVKRLILIILFCLIYSVVSSDQIINKESIAIREKYAIKRQELDEEYRQDKLTDKEYRIGRREIVLLRQKELLEGGYLDNDIDEKTEVSELEWINEELETGVKDWEMVCSDNPYPHNPYPEK